MVVLELIIVLLAILPGVRLGGIDIGFAGGLGVLVLAAIGAKPGNIPFGVVSIVMAVIAAISTMQIADGLDYLVHQAEKLLRKDPKYITILTPIVTYSLTIFAGAGNISLVMLLAIAEAAKKQRIEPCHPLSTTVVSVWIVITASLIPAAVVYMPSAMEGHSISYIHLLSAVIPSTLLVVLAMSFLMTVLFNSKLSNDPIYCKRLEEDLIELHGERQVEIKAGAKTSIWLFPLSVVCVVVYVIINNLSLGLVAKPLASTINAILIIMLSIAALATIICHAETDSTLNPSTFKADTSACICILGATWLSDTFAPHDIDWIKGTAGSIIQGHPWLLAVTFFFVSALLHSWAVTARALMSMAPALNISPLTAVASFAAVSDLSIPPTYPTLVAVVQMDDTGTTRIGKFVFSHPLFIPGTLGVVLAVYSDFLLGSFML